VIKAVALCVALTWCASGSALAAADPATIFARNCSSCHTFGRGVLVGPDLKGVTDRRDRRWLASWISSSENVIASGDRTAIALFEKFNKQRMPEQRLSPGDVAALLDYLAAGGPELDARRRERSAEDATPAEIDMGRALFAGERAFAHGGASCASCHRASDEPAGGTLGPDLSHTYARFRDKGLTTILSRGCFPRRARGLTEQETFALKAYLRHTAAIGQ